LKHKLAVFSFEAAHPNKFVAEDFTDGDRPLNNGIFGGSGGVITGSMIDDIKDIISVSEAIMVIMRAPVAFNYAIPS
jgi:hypothetical protein